MKVWARCHLVISLTGSQLTADNLDKTRQVSIVRVNFMETSNVLESITSLRPFAGCHLYRETPGDRVLI